MFRILASLVGLVLLVAGAVLLWLALGPRPTNEIEVGGILTTQEQVAADSFGAAYSAENPPDLPVVIDGQETSTNSIGAQPEMSQQALSDVSVVEGGESSTGLDAEQTLTEGLLVEMVPLEVASVMTTDAVSGQGGAGTVGAVEQRTVELEWTRSLRVGGTGTVRLTLKVLPSGQVVAIPEIEGNSVLSTPLLISDYYTTHNATYSARLNAPGVKIESLTTTSQPLARGQEATWRWRVEAPKNSGDVVMILALDVAWEPKPNTGALPVANRTIWSQAIKAEVNYVFGSVTVPQASAIGGAMAFVGAVSQFPMTGMVITYFLARRRSAPRRSRSRR